jgi:hypothetical protein
MTSQSRRDDKKADAALKRERARRHLIEAARQRRLAAMAKIIAERELEASGGEGGS